MKFLIFFFLLVSVCWAGNLSFDKEKSEFTDSKGNKIVTKDVILTSQFTLKKPIIDEVKTLTKDEQDIVEFSLKENGRKLVHKELRHLKNDYQNDFDRGTVEYTPKCRNYSFHKVIIPDGTIIRESNFTQKEPHTVAISGKNLTFEDCNLSNVLYDPSWILRNSGGCQFKNIKKSEKDLGNGVKEIIISHQVLEDRPNGKFVEVQEDVETTNDADSYSLLQLHLNK